MDAIWAYVSMRSPPESCGYSPRTLARNTDWERAVTRSATTSNQTCIRGGSRTRKQGSPLTEHRARDLERFKRYRPGHSGHHALDGGSA